MSRHFDYLDAVLEFDACNDLWHEISLPASAGAAEVADEGCFRHADPPQGRTAQRRGQLREHRVASPSP